MRKIFLIAFIFIGLVISNNVFAFESIPTHQNLTKKIVEVYNQNYSPKITQEQLNWLLEGTIKEDVPPRWLNHFFDPIYKIGWTGENESDIPKDTVSKLSKIFLTSQDAVSSLNWLHNRDLQEKYSLYEGDQTYDKAIRAWAYAKSEETGAIIEPPNGMDYKGAFVALGHVLHLLEDLGVPAHTRNDSHADTEPFEDWAQQSNNSDLSSLNISANEKFNCAQIDECFINLAKYTNENFYSKDTIEDNKYKIIKAVSTKENDEFKIYSAKDNFGGIYPFKIYNKKDKLFVFSNDLIHSAYWHLLSKQIVLAGTESIRIFFKDAQADMVNVQLPRSGTIGRVSEQISLGLPQVPGFVSVYGTLAKIGNLASSAWDKTISGIGGIFASVKNVLADALGSNDNFQQVGEVDAGNNNDNDNNDNNNNNRTDRTDRADEPNLSNGQTMPAEIVITEIMYNPQGADSGREWIEIFNNDDSNANLTNWKFFESNTNHNIKLARGSSLLKSFEYAVIVQDVDKFLKDYPQYQGAIFESSFSLSNSGETIAIKSGDVKIDEVNYQPSAGANGNGKSLQLINQMWQESAPTPGKLNKADNLAANAISSDSAESENTTQFQNQENEKSAETDNASAILKTEITLCKFETTQSSNRSQIIINEAAWTGTINSANDEWIELKNISGQEIDLSGWQLLNKSGAISVNFSDLKNTKIKSGQFLLLERTDDNSAGPKADLIYTGALANTNEGLRLFNDKCGLMDEVLANSAWPAGDNVSKKTMERDLSGFGWHTSASVGGTPKKENSAGAISYFSGGGGSSVVSGGGVNNQQQPPLSSGQATNNQQQNPPAQFYAIVINEIMYSPEGADEGREWIEIFNKSTSTIDLTNWKFFENETNHGLALAKGSWNLEPGQYAVISNDDEKFLTDFPDFEGALFKSSFSLSNEGEILALKNQDLKIDEVDYEKEWGADGNGKSLQLIFGNSASTVGEWKESAPTPGKENVIVVEDVAEDAPSNQPPNAVFSFSPAEPKIGEAVIFNAVSSTDADGEIVLYEWDFGDGQIASSADAATTHSYAAAGDYPVQLVIFDNQNVSSTVISAISVKTKPETPKIFISEIVYDGKGSDKGKEFIELYNSGEQLDLSGWSLKYQKESTTSTETLAVFDSQAEDNAVISKNGFLLVGFNNYGADNYNGVEADISRSGSLLNGASDENIVIVLQDGAGDEASRVIYNSDSAPDGKSLERKALQDGQCVSSQNEGEYLGNGCDTDSESDFEIREIPEPQNSQSPAEPRTPPSSPENFAIEYLPDEMSLVLSWTVPENGENLSYKITDISATAEHFPEINTTSTSQKISINEINRDYKFSVKAVDDIGLESAAVEANIFIPSFLSDVSFEQRQAASSTVENFVKLKWNNYPFVPVSFVNSAPNDWHSVVFYLNQEPSSIGEILGPNSSASNPYKSWGLIVPGGLKIKYPNCSGLSDPYTTGSALIMFNNQNYCIGYGNNEQKISYNLRQINGNQISLPVLSDTPLSEADFIALAFYSYNPRGPYEPSIGLAAVDKTKYYLTISE